MEIKKIKEFLNVSEAAKFIGVCANTVRNWSNKNLIKEYRNPMNNYRLYKKEDLEEILNRIKQNESE